MMSLQLYQVIRIICIGTVDSDWGKKENWTVMVPGSSAKVVIPKDVTTYPQINKGVIFQVKDLTIKAGAILTLKPGARLTVNGKLTIADGASLIMEHEYGVGGMSSLITNGEVVGKVKTKMTLPQNQWFYLGSSRKYAVFSDFGAGGEGIIINVYRQRQWWGIKSGLASRALWPLEGMVTNLLLEGADDHLIEYTGELNKEAVSRAYPERGFNLVANPYPTFISWEANAGWERPSVDGTIWYRGKIGDEMAFITYNKDVLVPNAKGAL